jgi:hypothetical protein
MPRLCTEPATLIETDRPAEGYWSPSDELLDPANVFVNIQPTLMGSFFA